LLCEFRRALKKEDRRSMKLTILDSRMPMLFLRQNQIQERNFKIVLFIMVEKYKAEIA